MSQSQNSATASPGLFGRVVRRAVRVVRWAVVMLIGVLLWGCGLALLGVAADLPQWRHMSGAALLALSFFLWWRA